MNAFNIHTLVHEDPLPRWVAQDVSKELMGGEPPSIQALANQNRNIYENFVFQAKTWALQTHCRVYSIQWFMYTILHLIQFSKFQVPS